MPIDAVQSRMRQRSRLCSPFFVVVLLFGGTGSFFVAFFAADFGSAFAAEIVEAVFFRAGAFFSITFFAYFSTYFFAGAALALLAAAGLALDAGAFAAGFAFAMSSLFIYARYFWLEDYLISQIISS